MKLINAPLAQWIERLASDQEVEGSTPSGGKWARSSVVEQRPLKPRVVGPTPTGPFNLSKSRGGEIGRRARFRTLCPQGLVGSTPTLGIYINIMKDMNQNNLPHPLIELISRIKSGEGKVQGDDFRDVAEDEVLTQNLKLLVYFAADLLDQREGWGTDTLTGLSNSSQIKESLEGCFLRYKRRPEDRLTVIIFDLDRLGEVNGMGEGHKGGDKLIASFASVLKKVYQSNTDMVGRWKVGDEFIVILRGGEKETQKLNQKFDKKLERTKVFIEDQRVILSATYVTRELDPQKELDDQIDQMSKDLLDIKKQNRAKENKNEEIEPEAVEEMEEKAKKRERKKKREMDVSGKSVFKLKELKEKKEENLSQDEE